MEKALEYVDCSPASLEDVERERKLQAFYEECPGAYDGWCAHFGNEADSMRFEAFSNNYVAMRIFSERTGKDLELNQYADCTKEEYSRIANGGPPAEDYKPATSTRKTFFIKENRKRKTEFIPGANSAPSGRATMVIEDSTNVQGTQVIRSADETGSIKGTQVIRSADEAGSIKGTQVIRRAGVPPPVKGTQVISRAGGNTQGTQVIQSAAANGSFKGTQVIRRGGGDAAVRGTQVIKSANVVTPVKGTRVLKKKTVGTRVVQPAQEEESLNSDGGDNVASRGTMVIKRQIGEPSPTTGYNPGRSDAGVVRATTAVARNAAESDKTSDLSLFGGSKVGSNSERTVRGTIVLQRKSSLVQPNGRRQTLLVSKSELDGAVPSIFSFFGGADSRNSNARGTIVIKKNKNTYHKVSIRCSDKLSICSFDLSHLVFLFILE
jgi:hypothetical protein